MRARKLAGLLGLVLLGEAAAAEPLLDGRCDEYADLGATRQPVHEQLDLLVLERDGFVWLCMDLPDGSYGTMDLQVKSAKEPDAINLHVFAQLGEWPVARPELAPSTPDSDGWWNQQGWYANAVWFNGMREQRGQMQPNFRLTADRELQIRRDKFGALPWQIRLDMRLVKGKDGAFFRVTYPADGFVRVPAAGS